MTVRGGGALLPAAAMATAAAALACAAHAGAATIVVNRADDPGATAPGGCSLRQAVQAANTNLPVGDCPAGRPSPEVDTIRVPMPVRLTQPGIDDTNAGGDLDLLAAGGPVRIAGGGAASRIAQVATDRVLHVIGANVTLEDLVITGGAAGGIAPTGDGGGIHVIGAGANLRLTRVSVTGNRAERSGGIANGHRAPGGTGGTVTVVDSTISGNAVPTSTAGAMGAGGIANISGTLTLVNSTVSGNTTEGARGGGIYNESIDGAATVAIANSTIAGNAGGGGANLFTAANGRAATIRLRSSIIAEPVGGPGCGSAAGATLVSGGFNLADDGSCALTEPTDQPDADPGLGPPEAGTTGIPVLVPAADGPAIDRGNAATGVAAFPVLTTDQRGLPRTVDIPGVADAPGSDATDIGAVEVQPAPVTPPPATPPPAGGPPPVATPDRAVAVRLTIPARPRITARGTLRLRVRCPITETSPPCRGTVTLRTRTRVKLGKTRRQVTLASAGFRAGAGRTATVTLRLRPGRVRLVRTTTVARRAVLIVAARDSAGNRATLRRAVVLRPPVTAR